MLSQEECPLPERVSLIFVLNWYPLSWDMTHNYYDATRKKKGGMLDKNILLRAAEILSLR
jgi:hypothetical protein